ncbi:MAG: heme biosynthesis protein HemY [Gammaproteobacteria bacterium]|nr:heme biosynthesis protein HemY [Gammaproteobacteria bacterium]
MRFILIWVFIFLVGTALTTGMLLDNGLVSMVWHDWVIETSLSFLLAAIFIFFLGGYALVRLVINLWHFPKAWRNKRRLKRYGRAENAMAKGMIALEYGDWHTAEKELIKSAKQSESGLVHYLSAAKMAHNQQAYDRRDQYLEDARSRYPDEYVTIGLVEARLRRETQPEIAKAILEALYEQHPKQTVILSELAEILRQLGDWTELERLLPALKKTRALAKPILSELEERLLAGKLSAAPNEEALMAIWNGLSRKQQLIPALLTEYVEQKISWNNEIGLGALIEKSLKKQWHDRLVYQYGRLTLGPAFERLKVAEKWLKGQESNPVLLLTLGRLACHSQLWGQGQRYLKDSLKLQAEVETFHALAQCYESEGKETQAALTYKEAILQLEDKPFV